MAYLPREARREQIINAVVDLVSHEGLAAATTRRIAQKLDCSPGQIHHHFDSTEALHAEAVREVWKRLEPQLFSALQVYPPRERLLIVLAGCTAVLPASLGPAMAVAKRLWKEAWDSRREPAVREAITEGIDKICAEITSSLAEGIECGIFPNNLEIGKVAMSLIATAQGFDLLEEIGAANELGKDKTAFMEDALRKEGL